MSTYNRSNHPDFSVKKVFLEILQNSREKHLCQSLYFIKVAGLQLYQNRDSGTGAFL